MCRIVTKWRIAFLNVRDMELLNVEKYDEIVELGFNVS